MTNDDADADYNTCFNTVQYTIIFTGCPIVLIKLRRATFRLEIEIDRARVNARKENKTFGQKLMKAKERTQCNVPRFVLNKFCKKTQDIDLIVTLQLYEFAQNSDCFETILNVAYDRLVNSWHG